MEKKHTTILRVALIGPESTAKTTLSKSLAEHYNTIWVPEYAREYLQKLNRKYTLDDILLIAKEQCRLENEARLKANAITFSDTELILIKVWCEDLFKTCPEWIVDNIQPNKYDLYLLTYPDIEWEEDPLRENPSRRLLLFKWYEKELKKINANYSVIKGKGDMRLNNAIECIDKFIALFTK